MAHTSLSVGWRLTIDQRKSFVHWLHSRRYVLLKRGGRRVGACINAARVRAMPVSKCAAMCVPWR